MGVRDMKGAASESRADRLNEAPADTYLPLKQLAVYAGLSVRTLRDYLSNPIDPLPHYRIGGKILVRRSEYDVWVQRFRRTSVGTLDSIVDDLVRGIT